MQIGRHLAKAERFEATMRKLDPSQDFELWMWLAMNGATQYLNAALHQVGLSQETDTYPGGSNLQVRWTEQGWVRGPGPLGDVTHTDRSPIDISRQPIIQDLARQLEAIEAMREVYVRGPEAATDEVITLCARSYNGVRETVRRLLRLDPAATEGSQR